MLSGDGLDDSEVEDWLLGRGAGFGVEGDIERARGNSRDRQCVEVCARFLTNMNGVCSLDEGVGDREGGRSG